MEVSLGIRVIQGPSLQPDRSANVYGSPEKKKKKINNVLEKRPKCCKNQQMFGQTSETVNAYF
jgi:hypothetical protein